MVPCIILMRRREFAVHILPASPSASFARTLSRADNLLTCVSNVLDLFRSQRHRESVLLYPRVPLRLRNKYSDTVVPSLNNIYRAFCYACYSIARLRNECGRSRSAPFSPLAIASTGISHRRVHALGQIGPIVIARLSAEAYTSSCLARFGFRRLSTDISYRCGDREGREPGLTRHTRNVSYIKYRSVSACVCMYITFLPPIPYSLSRNDSRDRLECYVWTRFAIIRASCIHAHGALLRHRDISIIPGHTVRLHIWVYDASSIVLLEIVLFLDHISLLCWSTRERDLTVIISFSL